MESIASFKIPHLGSKFIVDIENLLENGEAVSFCFDTGADVSIIGLNTVCGKNQNDCNLLKDILEKQITKKKNQPFRAKTVALEDMFLYPCKSAHVSVAGAKSATFYFYIYLGRIGIALLGFDYINACSFTHEIGKSIFVNAVNTEMSAKSYPKNLLDFHEVMKEYHRRRIQ